MKENYVKPQITIRNTCVKNYIICSSKNKDEDEFTYTVGRWEDMRGKDRNTSDDIWNSSGDDGASIW